MHFQLVHLTLALDWNKRGHSPNYCKLSPSGWYLRPLWPFLRCTCTGLLVMWCVLTSQDLGSKDTVVWPEVKQNKTKQDTPLPPPPTASHLHYPTSKTQIGRVFTSENSICSLWSTYRFIFVTCWKTNNYSLPVGMREHFWGEGVGCRSWRQRKGKGRKASFRGPLPTSSGHCGMSTCSVSFTSFRASSCDSSGAAKTERPAVGAFGSHNRDVNFMSQR